MGITPAFRTRIHIVRQKKHTADKDKVEIIIGELQDSFPAPASSRAIIRRTENATSNRAPTKSTWPSNAVPSVCFVKPGGGGGLGQVKRIVSNAMTPHGTLRRNIHLHVLCCEITPPSHYS